jgi:hypothetical protein
MLSKKKETPAFRINGQTGEVTEITIGHYTTIYKHLGEDVDTFTCVQFDENGDTLFLDDNGLIAEDLHHWFFAHPDGVMQFVGNAVVLGTNYRTGNSIAPKITKEALQRKVIANILN